MIIYLDLLFIKEILFNSIIIFLTGKIINQKLKIKRVILGSLFGAVYTIIILVINPSLYANSFLQSICAACILLIVFENRNIYELIKNTIIFYLITYAIGGMYTYIEMQNKNIFLYAIVPILMFPQIIKKYKEKYKLETYYGKLTIPNINEKSFKVLIDTGHSLKTCYDETVIILSNEYSIDNLKTKTNERRISYKTISEKEVCVQGVKQEKIVLDYCSKKYINDAVIIISNTCFEKYDAIIGLDFFERANKIYEKEKRNKNGNFVFNKK